MLQNSAFAALASVHLLFYAWLVALAPIGKYKGLLSQTQDGQLYRSTLRGFSRVCVDYKTV